MLAGTPEAVAERLLETGDVGAVAALIEMLPHSLGVGQRQVASHEGVQLLAGLYAVHAVIGRIHVLSGVAARITPDSMA